MFGQPDVRMGKAVGEHQCLVWPWEAGATLYWSLSGTHLLLNWLFPVFVFFFFSVLDPGPHRSTFILFIANKSLYLWVSCSWVFIRIECSLRSQWIFVAQPYSAFNPNVLREKDKRAQIPEETWELQDFQTQRESVGSRVQENIKINLFFFFLAYDCSFLALCSLFRFLISCTPKQSQLFQQLQSMVCSMFYSLGLWYMVYMRETTLNDFLTRVCARSHKEIF